MKASDKLRANWKKEDIWFYFPVGLGTKTDTRWLHTIFNDDFVREATERGYDISTFKFEICPQEGNERFESQRS